MYAMYKAFQNSTRCCPVFIFVNMNEIESLKKYFSINLGIFSFSSLSWAKKKVCLGLPDGPYF